jgi:hypothetical protein
MDVPLMADAGRAGDCGLLAEVRDVLRVLAGLGQFLHARWKPADRRRLLVAVAGNAARLRELCDDLVALIDQQTEAQRVKDTGVIG